MRPQASAESEQRPMKETLIIKLLRARLDLLESVYSAARAWHTAPTQREAAANLTDLKERINVVLEEERTGRSTYVTADLEGVPTTATTADDAAHIFEEAHEFQRFERVTLYLNGASSSELKVVCRCGWSATAPDQDPNDGIAITEVRGQLQIHVADAWEHQLHRNAEEK